MFGHLVLEETGKIRRRPETERVEGMVLLRAAVCAPRGLREKTLLRRVYRAGESLWERGVNRVLVGEGFPPALWDALGRAGLAPVETETLCRELAEAFTLALLEQRGIDPAKAVVCLAGSTALGAVQNTAEGLARRVGRLVIDCPGRGETLALWLNQEYGLPLLEPGTVRPDLTVAFSPEKGERAALRLYGPEPDLGGLALAPEGRALPAGFAPLPLLAALRESGCLRPAEVRVSPHASGEVSPSRDAAP